MGAMKYNEYGDLDKVNKWNEGKIRLNILIKAIEDGAEIMWNKPNQKMQVTAEQEFLEDAKAAVANPDKFDQRVVGKGGASFKSKWAKKKCIGYVDKGKVVWKTWNSIEKTGKEAGDYNFGSTGGSGAGAGATRYFEGAVCWYGCILFDLKQAHLTTAFKPSPQEIDAVKKNVFTDASWEEIEQFLAKDEDDHDEKCHRLSVIRQVNTIWDKHRKPPGHWQWFRGMEIVDVIENVYRICNYNHFLPPDDRAGFGKDDVLTSRSSQDDKPARNPFSDVNKWNPADIWLCDCKDSWPLVTKWRIFPEFNQELMALADEGKLLGVSLKKASSGATADYHVMNFQKKRPKLVFIKAFAKSFHSIDVYINARPDRRQTNIDAPSSITMQFRDTSGKGAAYQGELMGDWAKQGKCGGSMTAAIIAKTMTGTANVWGSYDSPTKVTAAVGRDNQPGNLDAEILRLATKHRSVLGSLEKMSKAEGKKVPTLNLTFIQNQKKSWKMSKYIGLHLIDLFRSTASQEAKSLACTLMFMYASSQEEHSGPFVKVGSG